MQKWLVFEMNNVLHEKVNRYLQRKCEEKI